MIVPVLPGAIVIGKVVEPIRNEVLSPVERDKPCITSGAVPIFEMIYVLSFIGVQSASMVNDSGDEILGAVPMV